jgi:hypothetical protein
MYKSTQASVPLFQDCISTNIAVYNNLAASLLQLESSEPASIEKYASIVIELDDSNEKAWYRKAQVRLSNVFL